MAVIFMEGAIFAHIRGSVPYWAWPFQFVGHVTLGDLVQNLGSISIESRVAVFVGWRLRL